MLCVYTLYWCYILASLSLCENLLLWGTTYTLFTPKDHVDFLCFRPTATQSHPWIFYVILSVSRRLEDLRQYMINLAPYVFFLHVRIHPYFSSGQPVVSQRCSEVNYHWNRKPFMGENLKMPWEIGANIFTELC